MRPLPSRGPIPKVAPAAKPTAPTAPPKGTPPFRYDPLYKKDKTVGSAGPVADLNRMMGAIMAEKRVFNDLPRNLQRGIQKIQKMTGDIFKYAAEEEPPVEKDAFLGFGGTETQMRDLKKYINRTINDTNISKNIKEGLLDVTKRIDEEMRGVEWEKQDAKERKQQESLQRKTEKEQQRQRARQEKSDIKEELEEFGREEVMERQKEKDVVLQRENTAVEHLKGMLLNSRHYLDVYQALPGELRRELEKLSLDPENLKYLSSSRSVFSSQKVVRKFLSDEISNV